jgi:hypothetical protein
MKIDTVICEEVIITRTTRRGEGTTESPIRAILQVFNKKGELIAENDPYLNSENLRAELSNFAMFIWTKMACPIDIKATIEAYFKEKEKNKIPYL